MDRGFTQWRIPIPGRLFLKIFLALWLAIGAIVYLTDRATNAMFQAELARSPELSIGYRAELATNLVAAHVQLEGITKTRKWFLEWSGRRPLPVLVVDEGTGQDILGRPVPADGLAQARSLIDGGGASSAVQRVVAPDGLNHLLFVPLALLPATPPTQHVYKTPDASYIEIVAMTLASFLFALGLAWYLFRPIRHLHEASQRFATGDLSTRVAPLLGRRSDELVDLGRDFDEMAAHLQSTIDGKTRLLHDVSHELRSPLTRIQVALGIARQSADKTPRMLDRIEQEISRLDRLLEETLALSRLASGTAGASGIEYVDVVDLLKNIAADASFEATQQGKTVEQRASGTILVAGRRNLLRSAIENVVRNALLHTPPGTRVTIDLSTALRKRISLRICDSGPGVDVHELATIFEPFYRGSNSEQRGGYGLGLSIVRRAIEAHGGEVRADNLPKGGLCVEISLPVADSEASSMQADA